MRAKNIIICSFLFILSIIIGCSTESYNINDEVEQKDTSKANISKDTAANWITIGKIQKKAPKTYIIRTPPSFTLQINGNYNYGIAELTYNYETIYEASQFIGGQNFGTRRGYGFSIVGKIPMQMWGNIRMNFFAGFNYFKNNHLTSKNGTFGNVHYNLITLGGGLENSFTPSFKVKPYIGGYLTLNLLSGSAENIRNDVDETISNYKFKNSFRIGFIVSSGVEYLVSKKVGLNFGVNLIDGNRLLRSSSGNAEDKEFTVRDGFSGTALPLAGFKQFIFTSFTFGINLYFGISNIAYKL